jgi:hypothetical protein
MPFRLRGGPNQMRYSHVIPQAAGTREPHALSGIEGRMSFTGDRHRADFRLHDPFAMMWAGALVTIRGRSLAMMWAGRWSQSGDVDTGEVLASGVTRGGSGPDTIMTAARDRSEPIPIEDGANTAARFDTVLQLTHPRLVEIIASGPIGISGRGHSSAHAFIFPGFSYGPSGPQRVDGFLFEIPGLAVSIDKPAFHFLPEKVDPQLPYEIRANVTMMCGCPIGTELWPEADFSMLAYIDHEGRRSVVPLVFDGTNPQHAPSQLIATNWRPGATGSFDITVVAYQKSTGNLASDVRPSFWLIIELTALAV